MISNVDSRSIAVAGVGSGIAIAALQSGHVVRTAKNGGNNWQKWFHPFADEAVDEVDGNRIEQLLSLGYEVRHRMA